MNAIDWKEYENIVLIECQRVFFNANIQYNIFVDGLFSKRKRQIDIFIKDKNGLVYIVDAKRYNTKVDVKDVESFIGMVKDVGGNYGIILSEKGFTKAAINRAHIGENNIEVDILNLNGLGMFQSKSAIPYVGNNGVVVNAPFGWVIDGTRRNGMAATLYQRGFSLEEATVENKEWAYINFWSKNDEINSLDALISFQNNYLMESDCNGSIEEKEEPDLRIRIFTSRYCPTREVTLYRDFPNFILFVVLFSPDNLISRNISKMKYLLLNALFLEINYEELS